MDRDLAELYGVETKLLKRAVRRNLHRFPSDFMFELTREEYNSLRSQFGTLKRGVHSKYLPMAFTEQGVAMLSSVLNSDRAIDVNIAIMRAFVQLRKISSSHKQLAQKLREIEARLEGHDESIDAKCEYTVITVCLDKKKHRDTYTTWRYDPYHYCLAVLLERFNF